MQQQGLPVGNLLEFRFDITHTSDGLLSIFSLSIRHKSDSTDQTRQKSSQIFFQNELRIV